LLAGASAIVAPQWPTSAPAEQVFWSTFYALLAHRYTLGEAVQRARQEVKRQLPFLSDWLAYTCFCNPFARPYPLEMSEGYTALECLNPEEPLQVHKTYYFRASIRKRPPLWHSERLVQTKELPKTPIAHFSVSGLEDEWAKPLQMEPLEDDGV